MFKKPAFRKLAPYAIVCAMALLACIVPAFRNRWPDNHDGDAVFKSVTVFKDMVFRFHEYFPAWTAYGSYGLGSPMPFFYHHVYFYIASSIDLIFNDVIVSVKISIFLLLTAGGTAVYMTVKKLFNRTFYGIVAAGLFIFSSYTYTQWLIRGAYAELTASVVFVWILFIFSRIGSRFASIDFLTAGILFSILLYSHNLIFLFALFSFAVFLAVHIKECLRAPFKPLLSAVFPVITILPYIFPYIALKGLFDMDHPIMAFKIKDSFIEIYRYFFDNHYNMGETWLNLSPEIGRFFFLPLVVLIIIFLVRKRRLLPDPPESGNEIPVKKYMIFVFIMLVFYIFLQLPASIPFYYSFVYFKYLQFPWRLLCMITPLAIILFIYYSDASAALFKKINGKKAVDAGLALILLVQAVWVGGNYQFYRYRAFSSEELHKRVSRENLVANFYWGEYMPPGFRQKNISSLLENRGLKVISSSDPGLFSEIREFDKINIELAPGDGKGTIVLNQIRSPFITLKYSSNISVSNGDYQEAVFHQAGDGKPSYIDIAKTSLIGLDAYCIGEELVKAGL
jgi:hypothetical protein